LVPIGKTLGNFHEPSEAMLKIQSGMKNLVRGINLNDVPNKPLIFGGEMYLGGQIYYAKWDPAP
jgi:hypothetical protein